MKRLLLIFAMCLLAVVFIAIPGSLAKQFYVHFALSPRVLPLWVDAGLPGFIFGFALPTLLFQIIGMVLGFCAGVLIVSRFVGKQQMCEWLSGGKEIPGYSKVVKRLVNIANR